MLVDICVHICYEGKRLMPGVFDSVSTLVFETVYITEPRPH